MQKGVDPGRPEQEIAAPDWLAARDVLHVCVYLPYHIPVLPVNLMPCLTQPRQEGTKRWLIGEQPAGSPSAAP